MRRSRGGRRVIVIYRTHILRRKKGVLEYLPEASDTTLYEAEWGGEGGP